jgi:hypothetical protein
LDEKSDAAEKKLNPSGGVSPDDRARDSSFAVTGVLALNLIRVLLRRQMRRKSAIKHLAQANHLDAVKICVRMQR